VDSQGGTGFRGGVCLRVWFHVNGAAKRSQPGSRAGRIRAFHVERGERRAVQPGLSGQNGGVPRGTQVCGAARGPIEDRPCEGSHQRILRFSGQFFWFHVERSPASAQLRYLRASESGVPRGTWTETSGLPLDDSPFGVRVGRILSFVARISPCSTWNAVLRRTFWRISGSQKVRSTWNGESCGVKRRQR